MRGRPASYIRNEELERETYKKEINGSLLHFSFIIISAKK